MSIGISRRGRILSGLGIAAVVIMGSSGPATAAPLPTPTLKISCTTPVTVGNPSLCTITTTGTAAVGAPSGQITVTAPAGSGAFQGSGPNAPNKCTPVPTGVKTATCTVSFVPFNAGSVTLTANQAKSAKFNKAGPATFKITVNPPVKPPPPGAKATTTKVACTPAGTAGVFNCTVTVSGPTTPTGTVSLSSAPAGKISKNTCSKPGLILVTPKAATCTFTLTTAKGSAATTVTAVYNGATGRFTTSTGSTGVNGGTPGTRPCPTEQTLEGSVCVDDQAEDLAELIAASSSGRDTTAISADIAADATEESPEGA